VITPEWIDRLREGINRGVANPSDYFRCYTQPGDLGRYLLSMWVRTDDAAFADFCGNANIAEIAARFIDRRQARFIFDSWIVKYPGTLRRTPWHQDWGILGRSVAIWVPLDPAPRGAALEVVRGSHRWGRQFYETQFESDFARARSDPALDLTNPDESVPEPLPDIDRFRDDYDIVTWAVEPGDCIVCDCRAVHGGPGNPSMSPVRRYISRWAEPDARLSPSAHLIASRMMQAYPRGIPIRQEAFEPFEGDDFPLLPAIGAA
jgi:hypothetical protein